jgi:hypothetical protein
MIALTGTNVKSNNESGLMMPNVPNDLVRLMDVLKDYKPKRGWWEQRIAKGEIQPYAVPGERGIWLSKADVERLTRPHPYEYSREEGENAG